MSEVYQAAIGEEVHYWDPRRGWRRGRITAVSDVSAMVKLLGRGSAKAQPLSVPLEQVRPLSDPPQVDSSGVGVETPEEPVEGEVVEPETQKGSPATEPSGQQIVPVEPIERDLVPTMVHGIDEARRRLADLQTFVREAMVEGEDFGPLPWAKTEEEKKKKVLLQPGAQKLSEIYGYYGEHEIFEKVVDWKGEIGPDEGVPFFSYSIRTKIISRRTGETVGEGIGSCSTAESKYRFRRGERVCPDCDQKTIIKGKAEFGGGWLCWKKKGGCGGKWEGDSPAIVNQDVGQILNDNTADAQNTVLKMAKKRAYVDGIIAVTRSAGIFTQDVEDQAQEEPPGKSATTKSSTSTTKSTPDGSPEKGGAAATASAAETAPSASSASIDYKSEANAQRPTMVQLERLRVHTDRLNLLVNKTAKFVAIAMPAEVFSAWKAPLPEVEKDRFVCVWTHSTSSETPISADLLEVALVTLDAVPSQDSLPF